MNAQGVLSRGFRALGVEGWMYRLPRFYQHVMDSELWEVRAAATKRLLAAVDTDRTRTAVDIACGTGITTVDLAQALPDAKVTGVDPSAKMIRLAGKRAKKAGVDCTFIEHDAAGLTDLGPADLITCFLGYCVIPDWRAAFVDTLRLLAPDGVYAIFDLYAPHTYISDYAADQTRPSFELIESEFVDHATHELGDGFFISIGRR